MPLVTKENAEFATKRFVNARFRAWRFYSPLNGARAYI